MARYRKLPKEIDAIQWDGGNTGAVLDFMGALGGIARIDDKKLVIPTLEGDLNASVNDWIIRGIQGEYYPCKPDIFAETYEVVEEC